MKTSHAFTRMVSLCLIACMVFTSSAIAQENKHEIESNVFTSGEPIADITIKEYNSFRAAIENTSNKQYVQLIKSFTDVNNVIVYPDYYAGAFLNEDGYLVVAVTELSENIVSEIRRVTGNNNILIEEKNYSYNYLLKLQDEIVAYYKSNYNKSVAASRITSVAVLDNLNTIQLGMSVVNQEYKAIISDAVNKRQHSTENSVLPIVFVEAAACTEIINIYAGSGISSPLSNSSAGFTCSRTKNGVTDYGFAISGHGASSGDTITKGGVAVGTAIIVKDSGSVDAGFVKFPIIISMLH